MEIRQCLRTVPSRPIALTPAALAVLALTLTGWYVVATHVQSASPALVLAPIPNHLPLSCSIDPYSPHDPICTAHHDPYSPHDPVN